MNAPPLHPRPHVIAPIQPVSEAAPSLKNDRVLSATVRALVAAVDARDPAGRTHSQRVTQLALHLGQALGLRQGELESLELAALLHDVGKIAVPEHVLTKPGPLDAEEWALIRRHPGRSAEIVREVASLEEVARVVRHHHERVDGGGYPDGLAGESIPALSRLIGIVDAYEAMTANRCYRGALSDAEARRQIREGLGRQFDPGLGEAFLGLPAPPLA